LAFVSALLPFLRESLNRGTRAMSEGGKHAMTDGEAMTHIDLQELVGR
jgi:hypothetical protein